MEENNLRKIKFNDGDFTMDINISDDGMVWLNSKELCLLFNKSKTRMSRILDEVVIPPTNEQDRSVAFLATVLPDGRQYSVKYYNLKVIKEIARKVKSKRGGMLEELSNQYLMSNSENNNEIIIYDNGNVKIDVKVSPKEDTIWLTKDQISLLFDRDRTVITKHINDIYKEKELDRFSTCAKNAQVQLEGGRKIRRTFDYYNLDMILSVGYRVKSKIAIEFRRWATSVLKKYLLKGYALSKERVLVTQENYEYLYHEVSSLRKDVNELEKIIEGPSYTEKVIYDGETYDGYAYINSLIKKAKKSVMIIDGYADDSIFSFFQGVNKVITKTIVCHKSERFSKEIIDRFINQYGEVKITTDKRFHDRFLIIDDDIYHLGSSLNNFGKKLVAVVKFEQLKKEVLLKLVKE